MWAKNHPCGDVEEHCSTPLGAPIREAVDTLWRLQHWFNVSTLIYLPPPRAGGAGARTPPTRQPHALARGFFSDWGRGGRGAGVCSAERWQPIANLNLCVYASIGTAYATARCCGRPFGIGTKENKKAKRRECIALVSDRLAIQSRTQQYTRFQNFAGMLSYMNPFSQFSAHPLLLLSRVYSLRHVLLGQIVYRSFIPTR